MTLPPAAVQRMNSVKRVADITFVLIAGLPLLLAGLATAGIVFLTMGRPVLFRQGRTGLREREFQLLKFRTMTDERDAQGKFLPDRERMPAAGNLLRKLSLDELPQFLNVLRGDMAIIGPRPLYPSYLPYYHERERKRHWVRPGITGLAQVSGRNTVYWDQRLSLDASYVETLSPQRDLAIFLRTIQRVLKTSGVSTIANDSGERLDVLRSYPSHDGFALRRFEFSDIAQRVRLFHDPRIRRHMSLPEGVTCRSTADWLRRARKHGHRRDFVVYDLQTKQVVAMLGVIPREDTAKLPEMYILVDPQHQGRGLGRTSLSLLLEWMRGQAEYGGCWLSVTQSNTAAVALYRKLGFEQTGVDKGDIKRIEMSLEWTRPDATAAK